MQKHTRTHPLVVTSIALVAAFFIFIAGQLAGQSRSTENPRLTGQVMTAFGSSPAAYPLTIARNETVASPIYVRPGTQSPLPVIASFVFGNAGADALLVKKVFLHIDGPNVPLKAQIMFGGVAFGPATTIAGQFSPIDAGIEDAQGAIIPPGAQVTVNVTGFGYFDSPDIKPSLIDVKNVLIQKANQPAVEGQGVRSSYLPTPDTIAPTVSMISPQDGATVTGAVQLAATASDNIRVVSVQFIVTGPTGKALVGLADTVAPYAATWNASGLPAGTYSLSAEARDAAGNVAAAAPVSVTIPQSAALPVLQATINSEFAAPSYASPKTNAKMASFILSTTSSEAIAIGSMIFDKDMNSTMDLQNLKVMADGVQFGATKASVADAEPAMMFQPASSTIVSAAHSVTVDVYADILATSVPATHTAVIDLNSGLAMGVSSGLPVAWPAPVGGQNVRVALPAPAPTLSLATSPDNVSARYVVMGTADNAVYKLAIAAGAGEDISVTSLTFTDGITNNTVGIASFNAFKLYNEDTLLAGPVGATVLGAGIAKISFNLASPYVVPKGTTKTLTLKADVAPFVSGAAVSGSKHVFGINSTGDVVAMGKDSGIAPIITGTPNGTQQSVYRTKPSVTASVLGATTGRTRVSVDELATLVWSASPADDLTVQTVTFRFSGLALSSTAPFWVRLVDANTNAGWGDAVQQTCTATGVSGCAVTFGPNFSISRGTAKSVKLWVNSSAFGNATNASDSLSVALQVAGDVTWSDGTTTGIVWEAARMPIAVANISYE